MDKVTILKIAADIYKESRYRSSESVDSYTKSVLIIYKELLEELKKE